MTKKPTAPKFQEDIQTDEELNTFLENPGLLVLDIYSEWCGPCLGMVASLRRIQFDVGGDNLKYAMCKADTIEAFKRFRRKSEPTWLFATNQKAVNIMFGSNVPQLLALIHSELRLLNLQERNYYDLNEYLPEEVILRNIKEDAHNEALALEMKAKKTARLNYLNRVTDTIMENLTDMGVTVFGPQVGRDVIKKILQRAEQLKIQCKDRKNVVISREHFKTIHFNCFNPISDDVLEQLEGKELLVCYWKVMGSGPEVAKQLQNLASDLQMAHTQPGFEVKEEDIVIAPLIQPIDVNVEVETEDGDILSVKSVEKLLVSQELNEGHFVLEEDVEGEEQTSERGDNLSIYDFYLDLDDTNQNHQVDNVEEVQTRKTHTKKIGIPPIWVPSNQRTHAALIYTYFRNQTATFLPPDPQPEPPYVVMAFDAYKKKDLVLYAERLQQAVPMYGFFTSDDVDEAKYVTNSINKYKPVTTNDKIVLKVQSATSRTMLDLVTYGPSYVSPNPLIGQDDVLKFFPSTYITAQQEAEEEAEILNKQSSLNLHNKITKKQKAHKTNVKFRDPKQSDKNSKKQNIPGISSSNILETSSGPNIQDQIAAEAA